MCQHSLIESAYDVSIFQIRIMPWNSLVKYLFRNLLLCIGLLTVMSGCDDSHSQNKLSKEMNTPPSHITESTKQALNTVSDSRILFAHHSVGDNIIDGLRTIAKENNISLKIKDINDKSLSNENAFVSMTPGTNKDPKSKIDSFVSQIRELDDNFVPQIAFMKFCYVDFNPNTDVNELFRYYKENIEILKNEKHSIRIIHVTAPLTPRPKSLKDKLKRVFGRQVWGDSANIKRNEFNELLIDTFKQEPIIDLANIESTKPNGARENFIENNKTYYSLVDRYTDGSGHLNSIGSRRVAIEMINILGKALSRSNLDR